MTLRGPFRVDLAAATCVAATTAASGALLRERGGSPGRVRVDARHATAAFRSERYLRVDGAPTGDLWASLSGDYRAADGWVKLHCNYPHHADAALNALEVPPDRDALAGAVATRAAVAVEEAVLATGGAAAAMRTRDDWRAHRQWAALHAEPLVGIERIGDAAPIPLAPPTDRSPACGCSS